MNSEITLPQKNEVQLLELDWIDQHNHWIWLLPSTAPTSHQLSNKATGFPHIFRESLVGLNSALPKRIWFAKFGLRKLRINLFKIWWADLFIQAHGFLLWTQVSM